MKGILKYSTIILLSLGMLSACESFFDIPLQDQPTIDEMFRKKATVEKLCAHMYAYLPHEENPNSQSAEGGFIGRTDTRQINASAYNNIIYDIRVGDYSPSALTGYTLWEKYYKAIAHCTMIIENIHLDKEDGEDMVKYIEAEARFMRAFYYFCLFRTYGPVIVWGDKPAPSDVIGAELDRNTLDENIDFIVSELDKAIDVLPVKLESVMTTASYAGRPTKGAAMALKSRVLLYAASDLYNGNSLYSGMKNYYGNDIFPSDYDEEKWVEAKKAAKALIDLQEEAGYKLVTADNPTSDKFIDGIRAYQNIFFKPWNSETIWGWWMKWEDGYYLGHAGGYIAACGPSNINNGGWQSITPSFKLVDAYAMYYRDDENNPGHGRYPVTGYDRTSGMDDYSKPVIDKLSGYVDEGFTTIKQQIDADWAPEFEAHNSTLNREPRYYACLLPNGYYWPCNPSMKSFLNMNNNSTKWTPEDMQLLFARGSGALCQRDNLQSNNNYFGYCWRRLYKADNPLDKYTDFSSFNYVYPAFRLAEIYFNYAECCIELKEYDEAIKYLDMIRERAGLNSLKVAYPDIASDPELVEKCFRQEKMIEFALEGPMHFYDDTRWMIAEETFPSLNWTLNLDEDEYDYYNSWERSSTCFPKEKHSKFTKRDYLFPFNNTQLSEMTNLTQNYGF